MEKIFPLISSGTEGPLGIKHLPRLWIKTLLSACHRLPEGYKDVRPGFDFMVLEGLGIDPDAARLFIMNNRPSYLAFEQWISEQPNVDISEANVAKINDIVESRKKSPKSRITMLQANGLPEDSPIDSSIMLNNLDDWKSIHDQVAG